MQGAPPPDYGSLPDTGQATPVNLEVPPSSPLGRVAALAATNASTLTFFRGAIWVFGICGGLLGVALVGAFGWVWSVEGRVSTVEIKVEATESDLQDHASSGGAEGHPASTLARTAAVESDVQSLERDQERTEEAIRDINRKLDEVLERLPRRRSR